MDATPSTPSTSATAAHDDGHARILTFATNALPRLEKWFEWLKRTQAGCAPASFRWRGRTANHTLASGIDDYPRAKVPTDDEIHVCWMALFAKLLSHIAQRLHMSDKAKLYLDLHQIYVGRIDALFWSAAEKQYGDALFSNGTVTPILHRGYVSLFPFLFGFIPTDSPKVGSVLQIIRNSDELASPYGLRSIAKSDAYFGMGENYWRGPIWLSTSVFLRSLTTTDINYLTLAALHNVYMKEGPHATEAKAAYTELRQRLITNMIKVWQETGFIWEQYSPVDGKGKGCHPFTGWSALIAEIILERYVHLG